MWSMTSLLDLDSLYKAVYIYIYIYRKCFVNIIFHEQNLRITSCYLVAYHYIFSFIFKSIREKQDPLNVLTVKFPYEYITYYYPLSQYYAQHQSIRLLYQ